MTKLLNEFLLRCDDSGAFQGAHVRYSEAYTLPSGVVRTEVSEPQDIFVAELTALMPDINLVLLNENTRLKAELAAAITGTPIAPVDLANWQGFIDIIGLPMLLLLSEITDPLAQQFSGNLKMELNKAPNVNVPWLCLMWNNSVGTIAVLPETEQFLNDAAIANNIPLTLNQGVLSPV